MSTHPISLRLDERVRETLEQDAAKRSIGLATYLRELAAERAKAIRKAKIRSESQRVGQAALQGTEAQKFYEFWGSLSADV